LFAPICILISIPLLWDGYLYLVNFATELSALKLDSVSNELALKTGVPIKKMPDLELGKLMLESSDFISYLINKYSNNMSLSLIK